MFLNAIWTGPEVASDSVSWYKTYTNEETRTDGETKA